MTADPAAGPWWFVVILVGTAVAVIALAALGAGLRRWKR